MDIFQVNGNLFAAAAKLLNAEVDSFGHDGNSYYAAVGQVKFYLSPEQLAELQAEKKLMAEAKPAGIGGEILPKPNGGLDIVLTTGERVDLEGYLILLNLEKPARLN
ncbi:MAG: hypothetical protein WAX89_07055 [Alphaproteobacteria bacterium]